MILVNKDECTGCLECEGVCPAEAIIFEDGVAKILQDKCVDCEACVDQCPNGCLEMKD